MTTTVGKKKDVEKSQRETRNVSPKKNDDRMKSPPDSRPTSKDTDRKSENTLSVPAISLLTNGSQTQSATSSHSSVSEDESKKKKAKVCFDWLSLMMPSPKKLQVKEKSKNRHQIKKYQRGAPHYRQAQTPVKITRANQQVTRKMALQKQNTAAQQILSRESGTTVLILLLASKPSKYISLCKNSTSM